MKALSFTVTLHVYRNPQVSPESRQAIAEHLHGLLEAQLETGFDGLVPPADKAALNVRNVNVTPLDTPY